MTRPSESPARKRNDSPRRNDVSILYLVKQLELAIRSELDGVTSVVGLTALQYTALTALQRHPGITAAQLARNSFVRAQSMADLLNSMMRRGLVSRERDPDDNRHYRLYLAPAGQSVIDSMSTSVRNIERLMLSELSSEEAQALHRHLDSCRRALAAPHPVAGRPPRRRRAAAAAGSGGPGSEPAPSGSIAPRP